VLRVKTALITGITGQDGAYLSRLLLDKGYVVHGLVPRCEVDNKVRLARILGHQNLYLHDGDLTDSGSLQRVIYQCHPQEIYNLAAQSHVKCSFDMAEYTANVNALGVLRLLETMRHLPETPRFYQASSSELFGNAPAPQSEQTPMSPCSPYAAAKLYAYHMVQLYRDMHGFYACNGILFNHESPWRGEDFVTRKVTKAVAEIHVGKRDILYLGNLDAMRDWGHARDYVAGMWLMLQQDQPDDYVLATGQTHSVRALTEMAFQQIGMNMEWQGEGTEEVGVDQKTGQVLVRVDPAFYRPCEVYYLCGDAAKARQKLGWEPQISFEPMVAEMVAADIKRLTSNGENNDDPEFLKNAA